MVQRAKVEVQHSQPGSSDSAKTAMPIRDRILLRLAGMHDFVWLHAVVLALAGLVVRQSAVTVPLRAVPATTSFAAQHTPKPSATRETKVLAHRAARGRPVKTFT